MKKKEGKSLSEEASKYIRDNEEVFMKKMDEWEDVWKFYDDNPNVETAEVNSFDGNTYTIPTIKNTPNTVYYTGGNYTTVPVKTDMQLMIEVLKEVLEELRAISETLNDKLET